jgi:hypothetical protein
MILYNLYKIIFYKKCLNFQQITYALVLLVTFKLKIITFDLLFSKSHGKNMTKILNEYLSLGLTKHPVQKYYINLIEIPN